MHRKTEYDHIYELLKEARTSRLATSRLLSHCGISGIKYSVGLVTLQKLEKLGFMCSFEEGRSVVWETTRVGADILNEMISIYRRLDLL